MNVSLINLGPRFIYVRSVNREEGDEFHQGSAEGVEGEIAGAAVHFRDPVQLACKHVDFARHRDAHHLLLFFVKELPVVERASDKAVVNPGQRLLVVPVDEETRDVVGEAIASGAMNCPRIRDSLLPALDLFHHHVERLGEWSLRSAPDLLPNQRSQAGFPGWPVLLRAARLAVAKRRVDDEVLFLEVEKVGGGIEQPVGMIDSQPGNPFFGQPAEHQLMRFLEDFSILHSHRGQAINVEEPAVVDLFARHPPVGQSVTAASQHLVEQIETSRVFRSSVEDFNVALDQGGDPIGLGDQAGQSPFDDLLLPVPLDQLRRFGLGPLRQVLD